jgi:integrase
VDKQRNASTKASLGYVIDQWMAVHEGDKRTLEVYRGYIERTIRPALGDIPTSQLRTRNLEVFYAELRRCSARCDGKPYVEHRVDRTARVPRGRPPSKAWSSAA